MTVDRWQAHFVKYHHCVENNANGHNYDEDNGAAPPSPPLLPHDDDMNQQHQQQPPLPPPPRIIMDVLPQWESKLKVKTFITKRSALGGENVGFWREWQNEIHDDDFDIPTAFFSRRCTRGDDVLFFLPRRMRTCAHKPRFLKNAILERPHPCQSLIILLQ